LPLLAYRALVRLEGCEKLKEPVGREFSRDSKKFLGLESTKGEITEERPLLLELD
jgi:hypothetical protein